MQQLGVTQMVMQEAQLTPETPTTERPRSRKLVAIIAGTAMVVILAAISVYFVAFRSLWDTCRLGPPTPRRSVSGLPRGRSSPQRVHARRSGQHRSDAGAARRRRRSMSGAPRPESHGFGRITPASVASCWRSSTNRRQRRPSRRVRLVSDVWRPAWRNSPDLACCSCTTGDLVPVAEMAMSTIWR